MKYEKSNLNFCKIQKALIDSGWKHFYFHNSTYFSPPKSEVSLIVKRYIYSPYFSIIFNSNSQEDISIELFLSKISAGEAFPIVSNYKLFKENSI